MLTKLLIKDRKVLILNDRECTVYNISRTGPCERTTAAEELMKNGMGAQLSLEQQPAAASSNNKLGLVLFLYLCQSPIRMQIIAR